MTVGSYISVIITAHDRKKYILDAVSSVLKQRLDRSRYEIVVVKNFRDEKIDSFLDDAGITKNFLTQERGVGKKAAIGVENASGDIICFLDDDDMFAEDKLSVVLDAFSSVEGLVYYHNNQIKINEEGNIIEVPKVNGKDIISEINERAIVHIFRNFGEFNQSSICVRKDVLDIGVMKRLDRAMDYFYLMSALKSRGKILLDYTPLTYYRIHESSMHFISSSPQKVIEKACNYYSEQAEAKRIIHDYLKDDQLLERFAREDYYVFSAIASLLCGKSKALPLKYSLKVLNNPIYFPSFRIKLLVASIINLFSNELAKEMYARMYMRRYGM